MLYSGTFLTYSRRLARFLRANATFVAVFAYVSLMIVLRKHGPSYTSSAGTSG
jgi:hypothetical protein